MPEKSIILIDAYAQIYRGYYAIRALTNSKQQPTNAVFAMAKFFLKMYSEEHAMYGAVAFDVGKPAFRLALAPEYKAGRPPMPDDLRVQVPYIKSLAEAFGWPLLSKEGYEADDLIAAIAKDFDPYPVRFVSADKDLAQIVSDRVKMLIPDRKNSGLEVRGPEEVIARFEVSPGQMVDFLSLVGDNSDNIPGVAGIGPKTAAALIKKFGSINTMLSGLESIENEKMREKIRNSAELLHKNIELITLKTEIQDKPWNAIETLSMKTPDWNKIASICQELELRSILKELPGARPESTLPAQEDDLFSAIPAAVPAKPDNPSTAKSEKYAPDLFDDL
ncbi:MAG: 5'-3' exonuclease H3TH domain-containing protein [Victivallaceae bacterium]|jgi:DNA polymerase-1